jgi:dihydrofolate reductase
MKLVVSEFVTLDGVMEDPGGNEGTPHGGWSFKFFSDEAGAYKLAELQGADVQLLGRKTYEGFAAAWPAMKDEAGFAEKMNGMPKVVVSTTMRKAEWNNSTIIKDNVVEEIKKLKAQPGGDLLVAGSATLVQTLFENDLVDRVVLMVSPILAGGGKRVFGDSLGGKTFALAGSKSLPNGVLVLEYEPATV